MVVDFPVKFKDLMLRYSTTRSNSYVHAAALIKSQWKTFQDEQRLQRYYKGKYLTSLISSLDISLTGIVFAGCLAIDVSTSQAIVRRFLARKNLELLRRKRLVTSSTSIQARWRCFCSARIYANTVCKLTKIQSVIRRFLARKWVKQAIAGKEMS